MRPRIYLPELQPLLHCPCDRCDLANGRREYQKKIRSGDYESGTSANRKAADGEVDKSADHEARGFSFYDVEKFLCCRPVVDAFSLQEKRWESVRVSQLKRVQFSEDLFKSLVIKTNFKTLIKAMVRSCLSNKPAVNDLIQGKGRGLVVLLHGSPGTGKTLTAGESVHHRDPTSVLMQNLECVAEKEHRPLYMVTCGDLGTRPDVLETKLRNVFQHASDLNAVLLLDEADVILQERDIHDLKRNALVSVFLSALEYFEGVLFITTNRPGSLDEAFQSRIHVTIGLPELDTTAQLKI